MYGVSLLLEGGTMRGAYCAGVLQGLQEHYGIMKVDVGSGSSSGIGSLAYYAAGDFDAAYWEDMLSSKSFVGMGNFLRGKPYVDVDYVVDVLMKKECPLDANALLASDMELVVPVTDAFTGKVKYLSSKDGFEGCDPFEVMRATMALPLPVVTYGKGVRLNGSMYIDGGYSDPVPLDHPSIKCTKKIICLTKNKGYKRSSSSERAAMKLMKRVLPEGTYRAVRDKPDIYWGRVDDAFRLVKDEGAIVIRPDVALSRFDSSRNNIRYCIELGKRDVISNPMLAELADEMRESGRGEFYFGREAA